ncbi:MAG: Ig-like domain-containing protein [Bacteroidales bacterium]|nr:Ig-like domain-containing protein [Bacteroidales bacterium]
MKTIKKWIMLPVLLAGFLACEKYDDSRLWDKIDQLEERIGVIEQKLRGINTDIQALQAAVSALQSRRDIMSVVPITGGFTIVFSDGQSYDIVSGSGNGETAVIGVKEEGGRYYWTITTGGTTRYLTDDAGNKLPVTGADGVTPRLKVDNEGYWMVSYDGGRNYEYVLDDAGNRVPAIAESGSGFFRDVRYEDGILTLVLMDGTVITLDLNEQKDPRLDDVIPLEIQTRLAKHIPLYTGINPPNVEGCYLRSPETCVFCEDYETGHGYAPGTIMADNYIRFSNQNPVTNTLDYSGCQLENTEWGPGAFICGHGNYLSAYFNTDGKDPVLDVTFKTALVISGTLTPLGIQDCYYAFIMVEKRGDTGNHYMEEDVFRVFVDGDGLAVRTEWPLPETQYVDMGLPSGVTWAEMNLGAAHPWECGDFYSWGSIATQSVYDFDSYRFFDVQNDKMTKYVASSEWGTVDGKTVLDSADDAARQVLGSPWRIPTITDFVELIENSTRTWTVREGTYGLEVKSKHNANTLFFPAAGASEGKNVTPAGTMGIYWTANLHDDTTVNAYSFFFSESQYLYTWLGRIYGYSIRPVRGTSSAVKVSAVTLNKGSVSLKVGETLTLSATVQPSNATNRMVYWTSENTDVATVANGVVTAVAAGTTRIRVKTLDSGKTAYCTVTVSGTKAAVPTSREPVVLRDMAVMASARMSK